MRPRACNFLVSLLQMDKVCSLKLSSESIMIPSKVSFTLVVTEPSPIKELAEFKSKCHFARLALR